MVVALRSLLVVDAKGRITPSVVAVSSDLPLAGDLH